MPAWMFRLLSHRPAELANWSPCSQRGFKTADRLTDITRGGAVFRRHVLGSISRGSSNPVADGYQSPGHLGSCASSDLANPSSYGRVFHPTYGYNGRPISLPHIDADQPRGNPRQFITLRVIDNRQYLVLAGCRQADGPSRRQLSAKFPLGWSTVSLSAGSGPVPSPTGR